MNGVDGDKWKQFTSTQFRVNNSNPLHRNKWKALVAITCFFYKALQTIVSSILIICGSKDKNKILNKNLMPVQCSELTKLNFFSPLISQ